MIYYFFPNFYQPVFLYLFLFFHLQPQPVDHISVPPGGIKGKTWGPSTYHQRERSQLTEFRSTGNPQSGCPSQFSKSAPNLDKPRNASTSSTTSSSAAAHPTHSSHHHQSTYNHHLSSRNDLLGKSHEGLNIILNATPSRNRNAISSSSSSSNRSAYLRHNSGNFKVNFVGDKKQRPLAGFAKTRQDENGTQIALIGNRSRYNKNLLLMNARQEEDVVSGDEKDEDDEAENVGCFGFIRNDDSSRKMSSKSTDALDYFHTSSAGREFKKHSFDNSALVNDKNFHTDHPKTTDTVTYDYLFYKKMQKSVDELFDKSRFGPEETYLHKTRLSSKSSGDIHEGSESEDETKSYRFERYFGSTDSQFRRECFFAKPKDDLIPGNYSMKEERPRSRLQNSDSKIQYLSLNDLIDERRIHQFAVQEEKRSQMFKEEERKNSFCSDKSLVELVPSRSSFVKQYSNSSASSGGSNSRKNSQVTFQTNDLNSNKNLNESMERACQSSSRYPPMRSEVSPRKFELIHPVNNSKVKSRLGSNSALSSLVAASASTSSSSILVHATKLSSTPSFNSRSKKLIQKREKKKNFLSNLLKKTHRNLFLNPRKGDKRKADAKAQAEDQRTLFLDDEEDELHVVEHLSSGTNKEEKNISDPAYDTVFTDNFVIARQSSG